MVDHLFADRWFVCPSIVHDNYMIQSPPRPRLIQCFRQVKQPAAEGDFIVVACTKLEYQISILYHTKEEVDSRINFSKCSWLSFPFISPAVCLAGRLLEEALIKVDDYLMLMENVVYEMLSHELPEQNIFELVDIFIQWCHFPVYQAKIFGHDVSYPTFWQRDRILICQLFL